MRWMSRLGLTILAAVVGLPAMAQSWPTKPVRIVVPFGPGGPADVYARIIGQELTEAFKQQFVIDNKPGAGAVIGTDVVAKAAPDGYTLLMHNITFPLSSVAQTLARRSPFNPDTDFAAVSVAVYVPLILTAPPSVPARDLRELADLLRRDKSLRYNYGSTGPGSAVHVLGEVFKSQAGVDMEHIPFKGAAPLKQELLAGRIQMGGDQLPTSLAEVRSGKLRALATAGSRRSPLLPDVPTVREQGFAEMELEGWNGVFAPAGTPRAVIDRLQREIAAAVRHPEVARRLADMGAVPVGSTSEAQDAIFRRQMDQFRPIIKTMQLD